MAVIGRGAVAATAVALALVGGVGCSTDTRQGGPVPASSGSGQTPGGSARHDAATTPVADRPTPRRRGRPPASLAVGQPSSAGKGDYILWVKADNRVYLVRQGVVIRSMPTTADPAKTPAGDYEIQFKTRFAASTEDGTDWTLPNFLGFHRRPGASSTIGFHQIPWDRHDHHTAQPVETLGLPGYSSHGCPRLAPADSKAIYAFSHEGTKVLVR